jgi:two-component system nitrate/nitrite response regulator NarL
MTGRLLERGKTTEQRHPVPEVLLIEDRRLLAESLALALRSAGVPVRVVADPAPGAVRDALEESLPAAAIVAVGFGGGRRTEQTIGVLCEFGVPPIVMTGGPDRLRLAECVAEGAVGIVDKSMDVATLIQMTRDVVESRAVISRTERYALEDELRSHHATRERTRQPLERLTTREQEVLAELTTGHTAREIADTSFVAISTVRSQIKSILAKLGVSSQVQAVAMAAKAHWFAD